MNLFKRFTKPTRYDTDYFTTTAFQRHRTEIDALLAFVQPYDRTLVENFLRSLLLYAYDLPGDWGIFKLTLRLATHAVAQNQNSDLRHKDHAVLVIASGLWAARSVPLFVVQASDLVTDTEHAWSRGDESFLHWLMSQGDGGRLPQYRVTVRLEAAEQAEIAAQAAQLLYMPMRYSIGCENELRLWEFALAEDPETSLRTTKLHKALGLCRENQLWYKFREAFSDAANDSLGTLKINTIPGNAFLLDNETFVIHPSGIRAVMDEKYDADDVLTSLIEAGVTEDLEKARISVAERKPITLIGFFMGNFNWDHSKHGRFDGEVERVQ